MISGAHVDPLTKHSPALRSTGRIIYISYIYFIINIIHTVFIIINVNNFIIINTSGNTYAFALVHLYFLLLLNVYLYLFK